MATAALLTPVFIEQRDKQFGVGARCELESTRKNADDGVVCSVEGERLADNVVAAAQSFLPRAVGEDCDFRAAGKVFARVEVPSKHGTHAQGLKESICDA